MCSANLVVVVQELDTVAGMAVDKVAGMVAVLAVLLKFFDIKHFGNAQYK